MKDLYQFGINACFLAQEHKAEKSSFLIPQKLFYNTKTTCNNAHYNTQGAAEPCGFYTLAFPTHVQIMMKTGLKFSAFAQLLKTMTQKELSEETQVSIQPR